MREQRVTAYTLTPEFRRVPDLGAFVYRPERGWAWAQRAAIWVLRKLGCHPELTVETWRRDSRDNESIVETLHRQFAFMDNQALRNGCVIYMGPMTFKTFAIDIGPTVLDMMMRGPVELDARPRFASHREPQGWFESVPIIVLPWMEGFLIAPAPRHVAIGRWDGPAHHGPLSPHPLNPLDLG